MAALLQVNDRQFSAAVTLASHPAASRADFRRRPVIVSCMSTPDHAPSAQVPSDPVHQELVALGQQLDRLLDTVRRLTEENRSLRHSQEQLSGERAGLLARNEQARSRVEAMIQRLKSLESNG
jgi:cell division protein ZapB